MKHLTSLIIVAIFCCAFQLNNPLPTSLRITVLNELGNVVEGADVTLFATDEDYRKEENPVMDSQQTDRKGRVTFKNLQPKTYFVLAEKGDLNNNAAGVQTDILQEGRLNKVNIIIE